MSPADKRLLEMAAKAAGINWRDWTPMLRQGESKPGLWPYDWNPLTDDGDALRLMCALPVEVRHYQALRDVEVCHPYSDEPLANESYMVGGDILAATRRAIVRAAAAIGEAKA